MYLSPTGVLPLPFQTLHNMPEFSSPFALWGLSSEGFSSSRGANAVVPVKDPCLARQWVSVSSTKLSLGGETEVGKVVHLGGIFWTWGLVICHVPLLPQTPLLLRSLPLRVDGMQIGKALWLFLWCLGQKRGDNHTLQGGKVPRWLERRKQLCEPCAQCQTCNGSGCAVGQKPFIFCLPPQTCGVKWTMQWDLFSMAMLCWCTYPSQSPSEISLSNAALTWDLYWCSCCFCSLCCSGLGSGSSQIPLLAQRNLLLSIFPTILPQEQWCSNLASCVIYIATLHLGFLPYHATWELPS